MAGKKKNNDMAEGMEVSKTASIIMTIVFIILAVVFLFPIFKKHVHPPYCKLVMCQSYNINRKKSIQILCARCL